MGAKGYDAGSYDYSHLYGCARGDTKFGPVTPVHSPFISALPLGGHVRYSRNPGVGDYNAEPSAGYVRRKSNYSKRGSSVFADQMRQHPLHEEGNPSQTPEDVGPGKYNDFVGMRDRSLARANPKLPPFNSSSQRSDPTNWAA
jgi:hypothetical protein